jgi:hypothetical protein
MHDSRPNDVRTTPSSESSTGNTRRSTTTAPAGLAGALGSLLSPEASGTSRGDAELRFVLEMFDDRHPDDRGRTGISRWDPERHAWPDRLPRDPRALDLDAPYGRDALRQGHQHRAEVEIAECRNAGRLLDLVWAGRVLKRIHEAGDATALGMLGALGKIVRERYRVTGAIPVEQVERWAERVVVDPEACPLAWRRHRVGGG